MILSVKWRKETIPFLTILSTLNFLMIIIIIAPFIWHLYMIGTIFTTCIHCRRSCFNWPPLNQPARLTIFSKASVNCTNQCLWLIVTPDFYSASPYMLTGDQFMTAVLDCCNGNLNITETDEIWVYKERCFYESKVECFGKIQRWEAVLKNCYLMRCGP